MSAVVEVIALATSLRLIPREASFSGFTITVGAYFCSPKIVTWPTPSSVEICCATFRSANWSSCVSGIDLDVRPRMSTGWSAGLTFR